MIQLYYPITNTFESTTYDDLHEMTGIPKKSLINKKSRGFKIKELDCYIIGEKTSLRQRREWYAKEIFEGEMWKEVKGAEGYIVSNHGRVKRNGKFLLPIPAGDGKPHLRYRIKRNDKYRIIHASNLVAEHFIREPRSGEILIRKNGIMTDNYVNNLKYVSAFQAFSRAGKKKAKEVVKVDKDTNEVIGEFRSIAEAGNSCFIAPSTVSYICNGKSESNDDFTFLFATDYENGVMV